METLSRTTRFVPRSWHEDDVETTSRMRTRSPRRWDDGTARVSRRQSR